MTEEKITVVLIGGCDNCGGRVEKDECICDRCKQNSESQRSIHRLDARDQAIVQARAVAFAAHTKPQTGDFIEFADGITRRIAHVWFDENIQTTDGGSFYLGMGYVSYSGSLYQSIPATAVRLLQDKQINGRFWFFHHDYHTAHNGVDFVIPCRVWATDLTANRC
jgi:hypothetical protein